MKGLTDFEAKILKRLLDTEEYEIEEDDTHRQLQMDGRVSWREDDEYEYWNITDQGKFALVVFAFVRSQNL